MLRYVLAFFVCKAAIVIGFALATFWIEDQGPSLSSAANFISAGLAISWFAKRENRPFATMEIFNFSIATVIADFILSFAWSVEMMWAYSVPFSWEGINNAVFDGKADIATAIEIVIAAAIIGGLQVFLSSSITAWLLTRKLPKRKTLT